eukprot:scaffold125230_cov16-Tisochrysis_lutea.AAC.1
MPVLVNVLSVSDQFPSPGLFLQPFKGLLFISHEEPAMQQLSRAHRGSCCQHRPTHLVHCLAGAPAPLSASLGVGPIQEKPADDVTPALAEAAADAAAESAGPASQGVQGGAVSAAAPALTSATLEQLPAPSSIGEKRKQDEGVLQGALEENSASAAADPQWHQQATLPALKRTKWYVIHLFWGVTTYHALGECSENAHRIKGKRILEAEAPCIISPREERKQVSGDQEKNLHCPVLDLGGNFIFGIAWPQMSIKKGLKLV